ncbi:hypothetical protein [Shewanella algicola]|uniref:hypothetical protein n=1 Tax=Shewanella algicola TaxID=640633 RepID=UPI002494A0B2|nr:hypothetical protein [Shewanella algicola]
MIGAEGLIGKTVIFIVNKTVGKLIDLPFDKRKKAARSLTKLYFCVQALDDATEDFFVTFEGFESDGDACAIVNSLNNNMHKIEHASNMFLNLGDELHAGLEIIDPPLAECCSLLYRSKFDFLSFMSTSVKWVNESDTKRHIEIKTIPENMMNVDLEYDYREIKKSQETGQKYYWPSTALDDFENNINDVVLTFEDNETARKVKEHIDRHSMLLREAKESLRLLLKDNFNVEEILFQNDSQPWK